MATGVRYEYSQREFPAKWASLRVWMAVAYRYECSRRELLARGVMPAADRLGETQRSHDSVAAETTQKCSRRELLAIGPLREAPGARRHPSLAGRGAAGTAVGLAPGAAEQPGWSTNRPILSPSTPCRNRGCPRPEVPGIAWPPRVRKCPRMHAWDRVFDGREPSGPPLSANTCISPAAAARGLPALVIPQQTLCPSPPKEPRGDSQKP